MKKLLLGLLLISTSTHSHVIKTEMLPSDGVQTFISKMKSHHDIVLQNNKDFMQVFYVYTEICPGEHHCIHDYKSYSMFPHAIKSFHVTMHAERIYMQVGDFPLTATTTIVGDEGYTVKDSNIIHVTPRF